VPAAIPEREQTDSRDGYCLFMVVTRDADRRLTLICCSDWYRDLALNRKTMSKKLIVLTVAVAVVGGGIVAWLILSKPALPPGFAAGNGHLEAKQVDIATKYQGRIAEVLADEGDTVDAGQKWIRSQSSLLVGLSRVKLLTTSQSPCTDSANTSRTSRSLLRRIESPAALLDL
jgi:hypothetical protein